MILFLPIPVRIVLHFACSGQNRVVTGPLWNFGSIYHLAVENERAKESSNEENAEGENKENSGI